MGISQALTGFNVKKGTVTVNGSGLTNTDSYTDILAENIRINGQITSGTLRAIAGRYTYNSTTDMVTADGSHAFFVNGIDVSALGGVTAGVILLQTTKTGVGVNNKGTLTADNIQITSNGTLINSGSLMATTNLTASSGGTLTNNGSMTGTNIQLVSSGGLNNNGTVNASATLSASAGSKISNSKKGTLNATTTNQLIAYKGDIENKGTISSDGTVYLRSGYTSDADNALTAVANTKVTNTGTISGKSAVSLLATNQVNLNSGSVSTEGTAKVVANTVKNAATFSGKDISVYSGSFENTSTMTAEDAFVVTGLNSITNYGTLKGNTLALNTNGKINNKTCSWLIFCTSGTLSADTSINITAPTIARISDITGNIVAPTVTLNKTTTE
ncbi:hemolysin BL-binding protein [Erwinia mallotivora]|uniref:hemolysin BL-binding protein n=1 Tax=Erwinia mallotivora TaxID=69222 RepID=UPI0035E5F930